MSFVRLPAAIEDHYTRGLQSRRPRPAHRSIASFIAATSRLQRRHGDGRSNRHLRARRCGRAAARRSVGPAMPVAESPAGRVGQAQAGPRRAARAAPSQPSSTAIRGRRPVARSICAASSFIVAPADRARSSRAAARPACGACEHAPPGRLTTPAPPTARELAQAAAPRAWAWRHRRRRARPWIKVPPVSTSCPSATASGAMPRVEAAFLDRQQPAWMRPVLVHQRGAAANCVGHGRSGGCAAASGAGGAIRGRRCPRRKAIGSGRDSAPARSVQRACCIHLLGAAQSMATDNAAPARATSALTFAPRPGERRAGHPLGRPTRSNAARWSAPPPTAASATSSALHSSSYGVRRGGGGGGNLVQGHRAPTSPTPTDLIGPYRTMGRRESCPRPGRLGTTVFADYLEAGTTSVRPSRSPRRIHAGDPPGAGFSSAWQVDEPCCSGTARPWSQGRRAGGGCRAWRSASRSAGPICDARSSEEIGGMALSSSRAATSRSSCRPSAGRRSTYSATCATSRPGFR